MSNSEDKYIVTVQEQSEVNGLEEIVSDYGNDPIVYKAQGAKSLKTEMERNNSNQAIVYRTYKLVPVDL